MTANDQVAEVDVKYLVEAAGHAVSVGYLCPSGYKQTEVGVIPEDWKLSTIGHYTTWMSGGTPSRSNEEFWKGSIPWISGSTLKSFEISTSDQFLSEEAVTAGSKMAPIGAVLLLVRGSALHNEIRAGMVVAPVAFNQDVKALVPVKGVDPRFLTFFFLAMENELLKLVSSAGNSAGVLDTELVKNFRLFVPSQHEQAAIANALSDADALINELEKLIAKKQAIKTATMQQLLTGRTRLPQFALREDGTPKGNKQSELGEIPEDWVVFKLGDALAMPATYGVVTSGDFQLAGVPMIRGGDIKEGKISEGSPLIAHSKSEEYSRTILQIDDVVIALVGYPGETAKVPSWLVGANISRAVGLLRLKKYLLADYLVHYLNSDQGRKNFLTPSAGSAQIVVNLSDLNKLMLPSPSTEEQTAIATILSDIDEEIQTLQKRLAKTRQIKQGMMQELLTGKTRLVKPAQKEARRCLS